VHDINERRMPCYKLQDIRSCGLLDPSKGTTAIILVKQASNKERKKNVMGLDPLWKKVLC
jgi:hypothetical protein